MSEYSERVLEAEPPESPGQMVDERDVRPGAAPTGATTFRVATYNIHSCVGVDARFAPERIARVIRALDTDVIGLQEVGWHHRGEAGFDQFAYLAEATGYRAYAGPTKHHERAHYGNALLTRLPVRTVRPIELSLPRREPRGGLDAEVELSGGHVVRVIIAHLGLDPWERNVQIDRILRLVATAPERPTVFMGDINEWRARSPRIRRLQSRFPDCAAPRSFHARLPTLRLDRIFVSPGLELFAYDVVRTPLTRRASDHLPVRATLAVTGTGIKSPLPPTVPPAPPGPAPRSRRSGRAGQG